MDGRFHDMAKLRQLSLLALLLLSCLVPMTTATARCYNPGAIASRFEEQLREEQALTAKNAYTGVFDPGEKVQIGLFRWYDPNLQRWINRDPLGEAGGINLYQFARNNPNSWFDADGLVPDGFTPPSGGTLYQPDQDVFGFNWPTFFAGFASDLWRFLNPPQDPNTINAVFSFGPLDPYVSLGGPKFPCKHFSGPGKPWVKGATPDSLYTHIDPRSGKAVQNAIYDANGNVVGHVDFKNHGPGAPSGHGHIFPDPGNPASGHGPGKPHIPNPQLPPGWDTLPPGAAPHTPIGQ